MIPTIFRRWLNLPVPLCTHAKVGVRSPLPIAVHGSTLLRDRLLERSVQCPPERGPK